MTVKELKALLDTAPENAYVLISEGKHLAPATIVERDTEVLIRNDDTNVLTEPLVILKTKE